jgi:hypothetical protein
MYCVAEAVDVTRIRRRVVRGDNLVDVLFRDVDELKGD